MMKVNNTDIDLGLALGINNHCVQSKVDRMTLVGSDSLSELVWSPRSGLSLKCTGSSSCFPDKKPCFLWDAGPSSMGFSPSHSTRSGDTKDEKHVSDGGSIASRAKCQVDSEVAKCASSAKSPSSLFFASTHGNAELTGENIGEMNSEGNASTGQRIEMESRNKGKEKKSLSSSESIPIVNEAGRSETTGGLQIQRTADLLPLLTTDAERADPLSEKSLEVAMSRCEVSREDIADGCSRLWFNIGLPLKIKALKECLPHEHPIAALPSSGGKHIERGKGKMKGYDSSTALVLSKLEATSENDIQDPTAKDAVMEDERRAQRGDLDPGEASWSDSRIFLYGLKGKGKEESLSGQEGEEKDEDESNGSMESCNSANLLPKGKRKWSFDHQLILGSKRMKKQTQECSFSTPMVKQDSSFMNWISNMLNGFGKSNQEEGQSVAPSVGHPLDDQGNYGLTIDISDKTPDFKGQTLGFRTVFQSLYSRDARLLEARTANENQSIGGSREIVLAEETCEAITAVVSYHAQHDEVNVANDVVGSLDSSHGAKTSKAINCIGNTSDPLGSLWITRLYPKAPSNLLNEIQSNHKSVDVDASGSVDLKYVGGEKRENLTISRSFEKLKGPEEMASVFARRLDAVKNIKPTGGREDTAQLKTTCFFCGKTGHGVKDCLEIQEDELDGLLRNISSFEGFVEETPCVCIRCLQLNHWASSCPFASMVQLNTGSKRSFDMINTKESQSEDVGSCSLEKHKQKVDGNVFSSSMDDIPKKLSFSLGKNSFSSKEKIPETPRNVRHHKEA